MFEGPEQVEVINLNFNKITILPSLGNLPNLVKLKLDLNEIRQIARIQEIDQPKLSQLSMNFCKYGSIPTFVFKCQLLVTLLLPGNNIKDIDSKIRNLKRLKQLYLMESSLQNISEVISELTAPQTVSFINNQITHIPDGLPQMIYLLDNPIKSLACNSLNVFKQDDAARRIACQIMKVD